MARQFLHLKPPHLPPPSGKWLALFWNIYLSTWKDMKMKSVKLNTTERRKRRRDLSRWLQSSFPVHVWAWNGVARDQGNKVGEEKEVKYRKRGCKTRWELQWEDKKLLNRKSSDWIVGILSVHDTCMQFKSSKTNTNQCCSLSYSTNNKAVRLISHLTISFYNAIMKRCILVAFRRQANLIQIRFFLRSNS